jgi:hypothetical protein
VQYFFRQRVQQHGAVLEEPPVQERSKLTCAAGTQNRHGSLEVGVIEENAKVIFKLQSERATGRWKRMGMGKAMKGAEGGMVEGMERHGRRQREAWRTLRRSPPVMTLRFFESYFAKNRFKSEQMKAGAAKE